MITESFTMYEMSINYRTELQAHSLSNSRTASIHLLPRRQLLADGSEVDAISGSIAKHYHAETLAEYFEAWGVTLCPACTDRNSQRFAALVEQPGYEDVATEHIIGGCGQCDTHGFLSPAKNLRENVAEQEVSDELSAKKARKSPKDKNPKAKFRPRKSKHALIEHTFGLALSERCGETMQLSTRMGDNDKDQALIMRLARSATYAMCIRYKSAGVGVDTNKWNIVVVDEEERLLRHRAILSALRDCIISPMGAVTATMLPHLTHLSGAIVVQYEVGRAPIYSPQKEDYIARLVAMENKSRRVFTFDSVDQFSTLMDELIETSKPYLPGPRKRSTPVQESIL